MVQANVEISSRYDGVIRKIHWSVGDMIEVMHKRLAIILKRLVLNAVP